VGCAHRFRPTYAQANVGHPSDRHRPPSTIPFDLDGIRLIPTDSFGFPGDRFYDHDQPACGLAVDDSLLFRA
jgi:hypothetical protein